MEDLKLSLCIPTNGVIEWVIPVLDSIYQQDVDQSLFEVIVTDNGNNQEFKKRMHEYEKQVTNLVYKETTAKGFTNQISAFALARGALIKFVNHRYLLLPGSLQYFIDFVDAHQDTKPYVYFSNGVLAIDHQNVTYNFNDFAYHLSLHLSWSAGIALWNDDFKAVSLEKNYSDLFPHLNFILPYTNKGQYIIDNKSLMKELKTDDRKKGKYKLFDTFAVEFMNCMKQISKQGIIDQKTYQKIWQDNQKSLTELYLSYCILKKPCSYDLNGKEEALNVYYNAKSIKKDAYKLFFVKIFRKIFHRNH